MPWKPDGSWKHYIYGDVIDANVAGYHVGLIILHGEHAEKAAVVNRDFYEITQKQVDTNDPTFKFAKIEMPCGETKIYRTLEDVPTKNKKCPCGNPRHWLVRYVYVPEGE